MEVIGSSALHQTSKVFLRKVISSLFIKTIGKRFLKRLLSEKPKIIEIRQLFVKLQQFENGGTTNKSSLRKENQGKTTKT